ncbi:MAG: type I DNA topoisomerase [Gemmatimonadota bacterium]
MTAKPRKCTRRKAAPNLVIVESPAKARTIERFLGPEFVVEASIGHVRDLPRGAKEVPARFKDEPWARLGVNVDQGFEPIYVTVAGKSKQITKLKGLLKGAKTLWLATDEDREGEAISWHLCELLKPDVPVRRLVFHEITRDAIDRALETPRGIDEGLVRAQEARRILDRLYGYEVSPLLWRKIAPKLSAGRVQSVAVRLVVQRERERRKFVAASWHDLLGTFSPREGAASEDATEDGAFEAGLVSADGLRVPTGKDFDSATGRPEGEGLLLLDESSAAELAERLRGTDFRVTAVEEKPYTSRPAPPFTTSTLQQEANRKLGFSARRTMRVAQSLYESGHITYMRTDSTHLAGVAVQAARDLVRAEYGERYLPKEPRAYQSKVKNAQEAHEAIRPAGHPFELPEALRGELDHDQYRLFELVWKRTVASQMADARGRRMTITIEGGGAAFEVRGRTIDFPGYLRAYVEGSDDPDAELADRETLLPPVQEGQRLECLGLEVKGHTTQPPARYTEASLVRALEQRGIGRPSTYASILETIQEREYVFRKGNALVPTWVAISVTRLLERHLSELVDYEFTAGMEDELDAISRGEMGHVEYLRRFYFGNGDTGLKELLETKVDEVDARDVCTIPIGTPEGGEPVAVRVGRYGPYLQQGEDRRASLPADLPPDELSLELALELLRQGELADQPLGHDPESGEPVFVKTGRYGPYVQLGEGSDDGKPKRASLLQGMDADTVDLETALGLLSLPRKLGEDPQTGETVEAHTGRYGPYVKQGEETRSLPADRSPLEVTLEQALALLAQPKRGRPRGARREPLQTFDPSPATGNPIELYDGRYGPYVTDGETNASLPKDMTVEEVTHDLAVQLLAERAARGPGRRHGSSRKSGKTKKASRKKSKKKSSKTKSQES